MGKKHVDSKVNSDSRKSTPEAIKNKRGRPKKTKTDINERYYSCDSIADLDDEVFDCADRYEAQKMVNLGMTRVFY